MGYFSLIEITLLVEDQYFWRLFLSLYFSENNHIIDFSDHLSVDIGAVAGFSLVDIFDAWIFFEKIWLREVLPSILWLEVARFS